MKKSSILVLVSIVSLSVSACNNKEVEYQEPTIQQEQPIDEDLTEKYKEEINKKEQLEQAKIIIEDSVKGNFNADEYRIITDEKSNTVILTILTTEYQVSVGIQDGSYYTMRENMIENSLMGKNLFDKLGLNVNYSVVLGDVTNDIIWLGILNGRVLYDCTKD